MEQLDTLLAKVRDCTLCSAHLPLGANPVLQVCSSAKILIAGQAPGRVVHQTGVPFDDLSGNRLRTWLGIDKDIFYNADKIAILPMGFCDLGTSKSGDLPSRPECAEHWREKLLTQLPKLELTLVIGQYAMAYHLLGSGNKNIKHKSLTDTVRNWQSYCSAVVLRLLHPSPRNNIWLKKNPWFEEEILPVLKKLVTFLCG